MKDFTDAKQQVVKQEHDRRRHQQVKQFRTLLQQGVVHAREPDLVHREDGQRHHADNDQQRLDEVRADHRTQSTEQGIQDTDRNDHRHAETVIDAGQGMDQHATGHAQADQPADGVYQ